MSVCDTCPAPGHCCRAVCLGGGHFAMNADTPEQAQAEIDRVNASPLHVAVNGKLPFRPLFRRATDGAWMWWCPNLSAQTGRCLDYANRPTLCRAYQPRTDALCVLPSAA